MVRFARKSGFAEKKEKTTRKAEDATKWTDMFNETTVEPEVKPEQIDKKKIQQHEDDYNRRIEMENSNTEIKKKSKKKKLFNSKSEYEALLKKHSEKIDKEVLNDLFEMKRKYKLNDEEFLERVTKESRSNARRLNRASERDIKRVCFKCRQPGHPITECPEMLKNNTEAAGICYKCGSTEHSMQKCKVKTEPGHFPYAKCFICHETGHITKQCPDNPRGLYPNGGACKNCSSVEHYARDCPEVQKNNLLTGTVYAKKLRTSENFEVLSDDDDLKKNIKPKVLKNKVVKF